MKHREGIASCRLRMIFVLLILAAYGYWQLSVPAAAAQSAYDTWAFRPVRRVNAPALKQASPVDNFILQKLNEHNLTPAPAADRVTLIRRATFDLHGLPPTPSEVEAFVKDPLPTAQALSRLRHSQLQS